MVHFIRIILWKEQPIYSVALLCTWIVLPYDIGWLLPIFCYNDYCSAYIQTTRDIQEISHYLHSNKSLCFDKIHRAIKKQQALVYFGVAILCLLLKHGGICFVLWCTVLVVMCLHSPWFCLVKDSVYPKDVSVQQEEKRIYCFEIQQHQRWWFPTGWSHLLLPQDPPLWSDTYLKPTPSTLDFCLPPPTLVCQSEHHLKLAEWKWLDPDWTVSKEDWQYANWHWTGWSLSPTHGSFTRKRVWYRRAERIVSWQDIDMEDDTSTVSDDTSIKTISQHTPAIVYHHDSLKSLFNISKV